MAATDKLKFTFLNVFESACLGSYVTAECAA